MPVPFVSNKASWVSPLFHALVVILVLFAKNPHLPAAPPILFQSLLAGSDPFIVPGSEFSVFKPLLPQGEKICLIMDTPFSPYDNNTAQLLYKAQSYLAPTLISPHTGPRAAIIFCSNIQIAEKRLKETGYRLLVALGDGKGIAVKSS